MEELHRVFVGGLFDAITKDELKERFQSFGQVSDVTIVHKRDGEGNISKTFGYVNLKTTTQKLNKCFALFGGTKWKGHELKVQLAKEDFMARLERERNEPPAEKKKKKKKNAGPSKTYTDILETTSTMRKIIPGTPVEGERNWVIGKYGRPLPIMHIPKVGSKKTVKVDPSKFCHCLRRLPDKDDDVVNVDSLTWSLDDNIMKIKKKKKKREHCEDENVEPEVNSTHENIEIEPIKKKKKKKKKRECNGDRDIELELDISTDTAPTKKKKKEKESNENVDSNKTSEVNGSNENIDIPADESEDASIKKKKKKKKKQDDVDENILIEGTVVLEEADMQQIKKKRKKEKKEGNSMDIDENELLEQKDELASSLCTMEDSIEESGSANLIKNELIIPETLFEGQHDESCDSNVSDDEKDKSILSKSIVEQLLEQSAASSSTQSCEGESGLSLGSSIVDQLSSLDKKKSEKVIEKSNDHGKESESESDNDAEENLFDFEFEDIAGENKKAFLEKLMCNIEVRDDTNGIADESSADSSSSDEESEDDDESFDVGSSSHPIEKEVSEDLTSTNVRTNPIMEEDISTKQDESPQIEAEKEVKPKKPKKKEKDTEKDTKKSKIQNSNKQEKHALSEEKRQKSLETRNSQIQQNKGLVSKALKDVDSTTAPTNRIVFSDNDSDDGEDTPINITEITETISKETVKETKTGGEKSEASKTEKPGTKQLFDDSDSEEEEDSDEEEIVVKPQFQGREGEKLFKLQQKFGGDERFKLDERFAENDEESEKKVESTGEGGGEGDVGEEDTEKEKEMNMSILEQVLGKPLTGEKKEREYVHQRYDPDNVDHEKFEVKDESADGKNDDEGLPKKKKKAEAPKIELPEVSKETFFDVNESIKDLFGKGESASFSFFGGGDDQSNDTQADDEEAGEEEPVDEPKEEESGENKIKEPSWKKGLEEMHSKEKGDEAEVVATEEKKEIFDKKYTFLYIPEDDERLEAGKRFKRTEGIEEVTNQWRALRKTLTEDYKKKHKDAVRRVRKMREKRFNRT